MFGIGVPELLIILVIILIIFGAGKLPEIGSALGKGIKNFKKSMNENNEIADQAAKKEEKKKITSTGKNIRLNDLGFCAKLYSFYLKGELYRALF
jgi:sec-independent protein translocase protein TatA